MYGSCFTDVLGTVSHFHFLCNVGDAYFLVLFQSPKQYSGSFQDRTSSILCKGNMLKRKHRLLTGINEFRLTFILHNTSYTHHMECFEIINNFRFLSCQLMEKNVFEIHP